MKQRLKILEVNNFQEHIELISLTVEVIDGFLQDFVTPKESVGQGKKTNSYAYIHAIAKLAESFKSQFGEKKLSCHKDTHFYNYVKYWLTYKLKKGYVPSTDLTSHIEKGIKEYKSWKENF